MVSEDLNLTNAIIENEQEESEIIHEQSLMMGQLEGNMTPRDHTKKMFAKRQSIL